MNSSVIVISNRILSVGFINGFASRQSQAAIEVRQNQVPAVRLAITSGSPGRIPRPGPDRQCGASAIWAPKRKDDNFRCSDFAARRCALAKVLTASICCSGNLCRGLAQLGGREAVAFATSTDCHWQVNFPQFLECAPAVGQFGDSIFPHPGPSVRRFHDQETPKTQHREETRGGRGLPERRGAPGPEPSS